MKRETFESEMMRADAMRRFIESERAEYWAGYIRGLRRQFHGERFGTAAEHAQWRAAADDADAMRRERGAGYRDGLRFGKRKPRRATARAILRRGTENV